MSLYSIYVHIQLHVLIWLCFLPSPDQYENDGFLVDDLEEDEAGEDSDDAKQKKRKKKR